MPFFKPNSLQNQLASIVCCSEQSFLWHCQIDQKRYRQADSQNQLVISRSKNSITLSKIKMNRFFFQLNKLDKQFFIISSESAMYLLKASPNQLFVSDLNEFFKPTDDMPNNQLLQGILTVLRGQHPTFKSQIAFAELQKSLSSMTQQQPWLRVMRQLILVDKQLQENLFCFEIQKITIFAIDIKKQCSLSDRAMQNSIFLSLLWKLIKMKSSLLTKGNHIFCYKRCQRISFLKGLNTNQICMQLATIQAYFANIFEICNLLQSHEIARQNNNKQTIKRQSIFEFIALQLFHKLMESYSCQLLCHQRLVKSLNQISIQDILRLKRLVTKFKQNSHKFINFINFHKYIKGFELMSPEHINNYCNEQLIKVLELYAVNKELDQDRSVFHQLPFKHIPLKVEKIPMNNINLALVPRLPIKIIKMVKNSEANSFCNWQNSYSSQFPQKEIMTIDLIVELKLQESKQKQRTVSCSEQRADYSCYQQSCNYDSRSTNMSSTYSIGNKLYSLMEYNLINKKQLHFKNIFSKNKQKWNK